MFQVWSDKQTHPGRKRSNNEDYVTSFEPKDEEDLRQSGRLYIVADGVGGASKGEKASKYAAEKVLFEYYRMPDMSPEERLRILMRQAGNEIHEFAESSSVFMRMATTMVAAVVIGNQLTVAHVGDSRAYLIRDGETIQLTIDHSWVAEMIRDGIMTEEEARISKKKNRITRSLGGETDVRVDINHYQLQVGDKILLCSDGFSQYARRDDIAQMVAEGEPDEITQRLIKFANTKGGSDNISVILIEIFPDTFAAPTVQRRRSLMSPSSLEEMATEPGFEEPKQNIGIFYRSLWFYLFVGSVIIIAILLGLKLFRDEPSLEQSAAETITATLFLATYQHTPNAHVELSTSPDTTQVPISTGQPLNEFATATPVPTVTVAAIDVEEPIPTNTAVNQGSPNDPITCKYQLQSNDLDKWPDASGTKVDLLTFIDAKLETTDGSPADFNAYKIGIYCANPNDAICTYNQESGSGVAEVGWDLAFPEVKRSICEEIGGVSLEP